MEFVVALLILSLLFLAATTVAGVHLFQMIQKIVASQVDLEKQRTATTKHLANLLASKDPIAYQMIQAATPAAEENSRYNGPYIPGEEYEQLLQYQAEQEKLWKDMDLNDGD